jgi:hypothetical protein
VLRKIADRACLLLAGLSVEIYSSLHVKKQSDSLETQIQAVLAKTESALGEHAKAIAGAKLKILMAAAQFDAFAFLIAFTPRPEGGNG